MILTVLLVVTVLIVVLFGVQVVGVILAIVVVGMVLVIIVVVVCPGEVLASTSGKVTFDVKVVLAIVFVV